MKLDGASKKVAAAWPLEGCESPSGMAIDRAKHRLFSVCDGGKMAVLDYQSGKMLGVANIGNSPDAAGFDPRYKIAFSSNGGDGTLTIVDANRAEFPVIQTLKTGKGARTMAFDALTGRIYLVTATFATVSGADATAPPRRPSILPDSLEILVVDR